MSTQDVTETPRHSVSVAAAIFDESGERVLLIERRDNGHWEPPGGVLELAETIEEGLRREVAEEANLEITIESLSGVYKNMRRGIVALVFRCRAIGDPATSTSEASSVKWHSLSSAKRLLDEAYWIRIQDAVEQQPIRSRAHDGKRLIAGPQ